ncbi:NlpC/P60 family protein [Catellatospora sp. NPDC049111]|uniref:C40 family peptidase n=1 Tax=Catellatospora sp. NPDC049111 TaxID=3155271 RepID=UPI0033CF4DDE
MSPLHTASHPLSRVMTAVAALVAGLLFAVPAHAEPTPAEIEAQITDAWNKLEPVIEEYNKVHAELNNLKKKAAALDAKLAPLRLTVEVTRARVGAVASEYYKGGRTQEINSLLSTGSPQQFAQQLSLLTQLAHSKQEQIAKTIEVKAAFDQQKAELDQVIADQAKKDADMAVKKQAIEADMVRLAALRLKAYGSGGPGGSLKIGNLCPVPALGTQDNTSSKGNTAALTACRQISKRYVFGANGPDTFDCSGLTQWAWAKAGVELTHYTKAQWTEGKRVSTPIVGDLVFFYPNDGLHHMGMYVGKVNGRRVMVHAPHTGDVVRMQYIDVMPLAGYVRPS